MCCSMEKEWSLGLVQDDVNSQHKQPSEVREDTEGEGRMRLCIRPNNYFLEGQECQGAGHPVSDL